MSLRCGVVGLNRGAQFARLLDAHLDCELVAVCDLDETRRAPFGVNGHDRFETMIDHERLDLVAIITPGPTHAEQSLYALAAGVNVLVETPNIYSEAEARAVVEAAERGGLKYMLAENYPYMGWCDRVRRLIESGRLGELVGAAGEYVHDCRGIAFADANGRVPFERAGEPGVKPLWRLTHLPPLAYSSHTLGPLLELLDDRCITVAGVAGGRRVLAGVEVFPLETAVLSTQRGLSVQLTNGFLVGHPMGFYFELHGTKGAVRIEHTGVTRAQLATDDAPGWQPWETPWDARDDGRPHLEVMIDEFVSAVRDDTPPPFDGPRSMDFCLPGVLAHESAKQGGVRLELPDYRAVRR